ncbi:hypothetical protein ATK36_4369 [Amycolatopsis sulphurea]|uniref:Uncharacterized protein n=1 Tax=Amycolatopsis sulphurea TaxID=76022 RepID=A0A2A9FFP4_9PSEU|nr:hypothetical protein [Amycolatopsis sulphurea]PFG49229.1 hypothetical protein ATK36_4369 [Amycolatopsis sulphurea]
MTAAVTPRVDVTQAGGKDTFVRSIRHEFATCLEMMVEASEQEWQSQTQCDLGERSATWPVTCSTRRTAASAISAG